MPNPKRKHSKARTRKRRTHYKIKAATVAICPTTQQPHLYHRAHWYEDKLYYKGKVVIDNTESEE